MSEERNLTATQPAVNSNELLGGVGESRHARYRKLHPEKHREAQRRFRQRHPEYLQAYNQKTSRKLKHRFKNRERRHDETYRNRHIEPYKQKYYAGAEESPNRRKKWTDEEVEMLFDVAYTDRELSELLGRSMRAIHIKRTKSRELAPDGWTGKGTPFMGVYAQDSTDA